MARSKKAKAARTKPVPPKSHLRTDPAANPTTNAGQLKKMKEWLLPHEGIFANLKRHGNTSWLPGSLVWLALCWAWSESGNLTDAFTHAAACCQVMINRSPLGTYQGFMGALVRWTDVFMRLLWPVLHQRMRQIGGSFWQMSGWIPIAFDGSRSTAPRSKANEKAFCAVNYGKGSTAKYRKKKSKGLRRKKNQKHKAQPQEPQAWITMMWHMGLRLPWMWRLGPSNSSERAHVMEMLSEGEFPENTLFCGDAGFVGYPLWSRIAGRGLHFLVRVGANVSLLTEMTECTIQKNGMVLSWPQEAIRLSLPPLHLRLVKVRIGRTYMWMLTNVLQSSNLPPALIVRFYKMRWGIEIEFRGLKQTLDRARLRCRNDRRLLAELNWSLMAMTVAELFALKEQLGQTHRARDSHDRGAATPDPRKCSLASTMRALRHSLSNLKEIPKLGDDLPSRLRLAVTDDYVRKASKRARYRPPNPDKKPLGEPKIRKLSPQEKVKLNAMHQRKNTA